MTREEMDEQRCMSPGCVEEHPLMLSPLCHPGAPVHPWYDKNNSELILVCTVCEQVASRVLVTYLN